VSLRCACGEWPRRLCSLYVLLSRHCGEKMSRKLLVLWTIALAILLQPAPLWPPHPAAACEPGEKLDKTTVEDTRKILQKAGYAKARNWRKGCDNTWHATAVKDGAEVSVAVTADGKVVREEE